MATEVSGSCPLCGYPATVTDWRPRLDWVAVGGCSCAGFFVRAGLLEESIGRLTAVEREKLARSVRRGHARGLEAWITTADGSVDGLLVIRSERPDRPT